MFSHALSHVSQGALDIFMPKVCSTSMPELGNAAQLPSILSVGIGAIFLTVGVFGFAYGNVLFQGGVFEAFPTLASIIACSSGGGLIVAPAVINGIVFGIKKIKNKDQD